MADKEVIDMEEGADSTWVPKSPDSPDTTTEDTSSNPTNMPSSLNPKDVEKGAKVFEKAAESNFVLDTIAARAYEARVASGGKLQQMFDWFEEDTQQRLLNADERTFLGKFVEKWAPHLDWRNFNFPMNALGAVFKGLVALGVVDAKEEMIKDMRLFPGSGIFDIPAPALKIVLTLLEVPELIPLIEAARSVKNGMEVVTSEVRERVKAKVDTAKAAEVEATLKKEHEEMRQDLTPPVTLNPANNSPEDSEGSEAA